jgi:hypothetical protein
MLNGWSRAGATLLGAAAAGCLLWLAAQVGRSGTGGYWAAMGIVAGAGIIFAVSQMRGRAGHPPAMFLLGFLPVLVVAGWVLVGIQPHSNWFRSHVLNWSSDMRVGGAVRDVGTWAGVLAFAIGYTLGLVLEPASRRRTVVAEPTHDAVAADEPVAAERREVTTPVAEPVPADEAAPVP